ncbi:efflux RND transporter periplasmic adaptor subunit [Deminuibacter soli]|uniref:Efflux RND transporter periplasmic adaptor subunit n=1 Tax=Deminuibacter soli TaxID=2291815 RepID=A0A3E1NKN9_9BACT|nr:efflux RND transporter periplasmic adaptor subunit [Deminuibacter soli]RFM28509.1 efflux RND transporter periplasmic adaptor subunit [Deminuibacter soli]
MKSHIIIPAACIILLSACHSSPKEAAVKQDTTKAAAVANNVVQLSPEQIKNAGITTGEAEKKEMHSTIKVSGVIDVPPNNIVSVSMPLGGYLKRMSLIPGERVSKGSVLATLEDQQYIQLQQDYLTAKNRLQYLEADYNRQKGLNETKATSDKVFQQAQAEFNSQKVLVKSLAEKLRLIGISPDALNENNISRSISIYAPISGFVTKVNVNIGKYVTPTDVLFELVNRDDLHLTLTVFENDAVHLSVGQKITCFTNNQPDVKYNATIHLITPSIGENRTTEVHCHFDKDNNNLFPGTYMNAAIELNNAAVQAVPEEAVVKWENNYFLFTEEAANSYRLVPVETGATNNGFIEIKSTLPAGKIVTKNAYTLLMKMKNSGEEG